VSGSQTLLFPDPRPLVERLGREFFRQLPESPGVYLMRDAADSVLYVGKAKNLRRRVGSYRVANPDRLPRRHLRLLRAVARIELEECPDEPAALARERELLRSLKPKFNRAGTWPAPARFLGWRCSGEQFQLAILELPDTRWNLYGPLGGGAKVLQTILVRLLWFALHPRRGISGMPPGWFHGRFGPEVVIPCGARIALVNRTVQQLLGGEPDAFCEWIQGKLEGNPHPFEQAVAESDWAHLAELLSFRHGPAPVREFPLPPDGPLPRRS
jgi:predicted GIY-YIG superfamily endonuclease